VRGVDRLRVIDASVMPTVSSGNINPAVLMIGEKGADLVKGRTTAADASMSSSAESGPHGGRLPSRLRDLTSDVASLIGLTR